MLRKNGKPSSCEPCRKSKISCDHTHPVCKRCEKRGRARVCFYHPAPMSTGGIRGSSVTRSLVTNELEQSSVPTNEPHTPISRTLREFGSNAESLPTPVISRSTNRTASFDPRTSALKLLWPFTRIERYTKKYFDYSFMSAIPSPFIIHGLATLRTQLEHWDQQAESLEAIADLVTENTRRPFPIQETSQAGDFHLLYSGVSLRWEFVGLVLGLAGVAIRFTSEQDNKSFANEDLDQLSEALLGASNSCISICKGLGSENVVLLWLLYVNVLLLSQQHGDTSPSVWRGFGDITSDIFAMNIHRVASSAPEIPFFLLEIHRRIFIFGYRVDKSLASFLGRPPRIPRRYCDLAMPLDLSDDQLLLRDASLQEAMSRLDSKGWNTEGKIHDTSLLRLRFQLAMCREDTMELERYELNTKVIDNLREILQSLQTTWDDIPEHLRYTEASWTKYDKDSKPITLLVCYLDFLHSQFLVHRMLNQNLQTSSPDLMQVCTKLLAGTIDITRHKGKMLKEYNHRDIPWVLLYFGLPSASIVLTELRNATLSRRHLASTISRAEAIKNLAALVSALEWIPEPGHRYYDLCTDACGRFKVLFDEFLNFQPGLEGDFHNSATGPDQNQGIGLSGADETQSLDNDAFLSWLDGLDWNRTIPTL